MTGAERIAAERQRQIEQEGWSTKHDTQHAHAELNSAAEAYLWAARMIWHGSPVANLRLSPQYWPWAESWWKPSADPVRNLEKAGALIAAEIDRVTTERTTEGEG